jgi:GTP-binding protein
MPQTRFVLKKSLELGLRPIVVLNKIDKPAARPEEVSEMVYELFLDLGATDEQLDFPVVYAVGRDGVAMHQLGDERKNLEPLLDTILKMCHRLVTRSEVWRDNFWHSLSISGMTILSGRLAIARMYSGVLRVNDSHLCQKRCGQMRAGARGQAVHFSRDGARRSHTGRGR